MNSIKYPKNMPQLPSGKHFALDPSPIQQIVSEAYEGVKSHELMAIDSVVKLFSHINVLYFRPTTEKNHLSLSEYAIEPPEGLEPYFSGFNLVSIKDEVEKWETDDINAFIAFLNEKRVNNFLEDILETVKQYQKQLTDQPETLQGMLALWWKLGIHPLQDEDN